jgi:hypothetical protein
MSPKTKSKFHIDIEDTIFDWNENTITVQQIRDLGGLPADTPVIEVDFKDNSERELPENEVIQLKPGQGFGKKLGYRRG